MSLNWPKLVAQGRAKDIGIAWTPEELEELLVLEQKTNSRTEAASILRNGKVVKRDELESEAKAEGINFAPETPDTVLANEIKGKKGKKKPA